MRPLTPTLQAAQQAPTGAPSVTAVLRARRGLASRLDPTTIWVGTLADACVACAQTANGNILRSRLSGGHVQVQSYPPSDSLDWTTWDNLDSAFVPSGSFGGLALSALGHTATIVYLSAAGTIAVRDSTNDGAAWSSATTLTIAGNVTDVALAYAPSGDLVLIAGDGGGTVHAWRRPSGGSFAAEPSLAPAGATYINAVAIAYSGDWLVLVSWSQGSLMELGAAVYGNGALQAANTWSAPVLVLPTAAGSGPAVIPSGFAWGADGGHLLLVEQWAITGGYTATPSYLAHCGSSTDFAAGRFLEPAPFGYGYASGCDIAPSQVAGAGSYVACGQNLVATLTPPADQDVSSRVVAIRLESGMHGGTLALTLDNADGAITALATSPGTLGQRLDLSLGYPTSNGLEESPQPQRFIVAVSSTWQAGRQLVMIAAHDGWQLLHQTVMRRQVSFGPALGLTALSIDQLLAWLCARAGLVYTSPATVTTLAQRVPTFHLLPGRSLSIAVLDLLDQIEGFLLLRDSGATTMPLSATDAAVYTYANDGAHHPLTQLFHQQDLQPLNLVSVYTGAHDQNLSAQAFDSGQAGYLGALSHDHVDTQLDPSLAQATANALLRKGQLSAPTHELAGPPNVAQELGDVVQVTDPLTGTSYTGRVRAITLELDRDSGKWQQTLSLTTP